jgi:hypothetical protein
MNGQIVEASSVDNLFRELHSLDKKLDSAMESCNDKIFEAASNAIDSSDYNLEQFQREFEKKLTHLSIDISDSMAVLTECDEGNIHHLND